MLKNRVCATLRKTFILLLICLITCLCFCSCNKVKFPIVDTDRVYTNSVNFAGEFTFFINVLTKSRKIDVGYIGVAGKNTESLDVKVNLYYTEDEMVKAKGCYLNTYIFICKTQEKDVKINSVRLNINGEEKDYTLKEPVVYHYKPDEYCDMFQIDAVCAFCAATLDPGAQREYKLGAVYDGSKYVLDGLNFSLNKGETATIHGASGCGKSTFLNIVGMLDSFSEGSYTFDGKEILQKKLNSYSAQRANDIGFIFQA